MIRLDKKLVDEVIRLTKKYYKTSDIDYLDAHYEAKEALRENTSWRNVALIEDLAKYTQRSGNGTYDDIYRALALFGIIVEDKEELK